MMGHWGCAQGSLHNIGLDSQDNGNALLKAVPDQHFNVTLRTALPCVFSFIDFLPQSEKKKYTCSLMVFISL